MTIEIFRPHGAIRQARDRHFADRQVCNVVVVQFFPLHTLIHACRSKPHELERVQAIEKFWGKTIKPLLIDSDDLEAQVTGK